MPSLEALCRLAIGALLLALAVTGVPHRRRADRAGGPVSLRVDPPWFWPALALVAPPVAAAVLAFLVQPEWIRFASVPLPAALRLSGLPLAAAGAALFAWMFRHLGLNVTSTSAPRAAGVLVTSGPYRWIRHPMYTATLVLVVAVSLLTGNLVVLVGGLAMFGLLAARSVREEARLVEKFGAAYLAYRQRTGRFFPRHFRFDSSSAARLF